MIRAEKNILVIGAGVAGQLLKKEIDKNYRSYRIIGFVDDKSSSRLPILGKIADCQKIIHRYPIDEIIIAIPSADGGLIRRILLANINNRVPLKIVPRSHHVVGEKDVRYEQVKDVDPEDFLGRPFIHKNANRLKRFYKGKIVFVTGGAGSIGSEIVRQLIELEVKKVIVYDNSEYLIFMLEQQLRELGHRDKCELVIGSVLNRDKLNHLFRTMKPDIIFHAAAYKHVHLMEDNIDESIQNNVVGTKRVIDAAIKNNVKLFTFISTDKAVNATSIMGATKKLCEYYIASVRKAKTKFHVVRFGNVINSHGSVLPLFERQIALHRYVTVTHKKMKRFFMSIREAAQLVIETTASNKENSIHLLNMGELINVYEIALSLISSKNLLPNDDVEVRFTGLRKGEKLVEELYTTSERKNLQKSKDNRIFSLKYEEKSPFDIHKAIAELEMTILENGGQKRLRKMVRKLFPSLKYRQ